jgi:hypothetical protein
MAKASWNTVSPDSGTGNGTVSSGASAHTGRSSRQSTLTFAASGANSVSVTATQSAAGNILTADSSTVSFAKGGETKTATGYANTTKLTLALAGTGFSLGDLNITVGSTTTKQLSGTAISGDPGASEKYKWSVSLTAASNPTVSARTGTLTLTPQEGTAITVSLSQAAGDATLSVSPASITIPAAGTAQSIAVTSNTAWTVS